MKILPALLLFTTVASFGQIGFEQEKILIDRHQMPYVNTEILTADLNGDGTKDLIATGRGEGYITIHPNIGGDFTEVPSILVLATQSEYPANVSVLDVDNDNLPDIIFCNRFDNEINWFRNLGGFHFSGLLQLFAVSNAPNLAIVTDVDNDNFDDIVVALDTNHTVVWLKNSGNGTFANPQLICSTSPSFSVGKIVHMDLDNDGKVDFITGNNDGSVNWTKNLGNNTFAANAALGYADTAKSFGLIDLNNDNYPDLFLSNNNHLYHKLNNANGTFAAAVDDFNLGYDFRQIQFADVDHDGLTDLVGTTGTSVTYVKRTLLGNLQNPTVVITANPVNYCIAEDINNDGLTDFIVPTYASTSGSTVNRLTAYTKNPTGYTPQLVSYYNGAVFGVKSADLDNDGKNDIISSFKSVVWNKNKGNGNFTSYKKISTNFSDIFTFEVEAADIDNDNDNDIIATTQAGIEIYYNDGNGNFTMGFNFPLQYASRNIEIADMNGDQLKDIVMTFRSGVGSGYVSLAWIPNLNGTAFGSLTTIGTSVYGYEPYLLVCADMDNDSDMDIVTYSNEYSRVHLHKNNGNGTFVMSLVYQPISAVCMAVEDYDNDGDKDIFLAGNYYAGVYMIKNNNMLFSGPTLIDYKKADNMIFADLNSDGLKELVVTASEDSSLGTLSYFENNGIGFGNQVILNSSTDYSLSRNLAIADVNNDSKPDIVCSYYYSSKVSYFLNSTTLAIADFDPDPQLSFFPVPFREILEWPISDVDWNEISIHDETGKRMLHKAVSGSSVDLSSLPTGIYIAILKSGSKSFSRKIIKN